MTFCCFHIHWEYSLLYVLYSNNLLQSQYTLYCNAEHIIHTFFLSLHLPAPRSSTCLGHSVKPVILPDSRHANIPCDLYIRTVQTCCHTPAFINHLQVTLAWCLFNLNTWLVLDLWDEGNKSAFFYLVLALDEQKSLNKEFITTMEAD